MISSPLNLTIVNQKFFLEKKIKFLVQQSKKKNIHCIFYNSEQNNLYNLEQELKTTNFFSTKKIIIIKKSNLLFESITIKNNFLFNYFKNPRLDVILYFFSKNFNFSLDIKNILNKYFKINEIPILQKKDFFIYVKKKLKKKGLDISDKIIISLIEKTNYNLFFLEEEIKKIQIYSYYEPKINKNILENLVFSDFEYYIFKLINYFLNNKISSAHNILKYLIQNKEDVYYIINQMFIKLKQLIIVQDLLLKKHNQSQISSILNFSPGKVYFLIKETYLFSINQITHLFMNLLELKYLIKTNQIDSNIGLEIFMINICFNRSVPKP
ncbi:DNA polymerase III, delta subunit [Candidatus Phytoplasma mali]|uniref:DNA-directed DNA polymerase n=1 Tax=Phytoplasma mali (strain AT) TaxID=482235 RepID=B3QZQ4_PHYMT|nr:DNA polymerase III subunit delta [Candidatus Phytoplasma mali]CAP18441.1 DNA polymerase III, delta subunit [Candidatus Phytoplasma mali]